DMLESRSRITVDEMNAPPDYAALVKLLPALRTLVDACGEVTLTAYEAERIGSLGFDANAGRWHVPPVPPELVRDNPLLEHLSVGWETPRVEAGLVPTDQHGRQCQEQAEESMRVVAFVDSEDPSAADKPCNAREQVPRPRQRRKAWQFPVKAFLN